MLKAALQLFEKSSVVQLKKLNARQNRDAMSSMAILMICYYYPPLADVGTKRSVAFSTYFKKYGWQPIVLSVKNPDRSYCFVGDGKPPCDVSIEYSYSIANVYKLLGKLNGMITKVFKSSRSEFRRNYLYDLFCIPDIFWGWVPLTLIKALKLMKRYKIHCIYASCSPFSSALIGMCLKTITHKPLIIDFRDIYALKIESIKHVPPKPPFREKIDIWIEGRILDRADLFIVTTRGMESLYTQNYPHRSGKIFTVHNGFEPGTLSTNSSPRKYNKFTICYAGNFYFEAAGRELFFEALALLRKKGQIHENNFQFLYYGDFWSAIRGMAGQFGVEDLVKANPRIAHEMLLPVIKSSHLQLLRIIEPMISTKLFEGIALNIPLLATIPAGEVADIITQFSPASYVVSQHDSTRIADAILDAMDRYKKGEIEDNYVGEFLKDFSRESLSLKLIRIIIENLPKQRGM